jgi:hypothetical protein
VGRAFTTPEMMELERDNIEQMKSGQGKYPPVVQNAERAEHLSDSQRQAVDTVLETATRSRDYRAQRVRGKLLL